MQIGIDLVELDEFQKQITSSPQTLDKYLSKAEQTGRSLESLAGLFAAKEAAIKSGVIKKGEWLKLEISTTAEGKPFFKNEKNLSLSITHTNKTAAAVVVNTLN